MAVFSKYGVPLPGGRGAVAMPKQKQRFRVILNGFGSGVSGNSNDGEIITLETESVDKPKLKFDRIDQKYMGTMVSDISGHTWGEIELTVRDSITNHQLRAVANHIQRQIEQRRIVGHRPDTKFEMMIQTLNGDDMRKLYGGDNNMLGDGFTNTLNKYADQLYTTALGSFADLAESSDTTFGKLLGDYLTPRESDVPELFYNTQDTWVLVGCTLQDYDFDQHTYEESSHLVMKLRIKPDNCYLLDNRGMPMPRENPRNGATNNDTIDNILGMVGHGGLVQDVLNSNIDDLFRRN